MAEELGIPPSTWQGYEDGSSNPTVRNMAIMIAYFNMTEHDLEYKNLSEKNVLEEETAPYDTTKALKAENKALKNEVKLLTDNVDTFKNLVESKNKEIESKGLEILSLKNELNELKSKMLT